MLNYLVNSTHPELAYSVHQCVQICNDPKASHERAVERVIRYLKSTQLGPTECQGIIYLPDRNKSLELYVDASFTGDWNVDGSDEPSLVFSCTGYVIKYANCLVICLSKIQSEITLSTTESEYVALSQSLRDVIPLIAILKELSSAIPALINAPKVH